MIILLFLLISFSSFSQQSLAEITGETRSIYRALQKAKQDNNYTLIEFREDVYRLGIIAGIPYNKSAKRNLILLNSKVFYLINNKPYYKTWKEKY